MSNITETDLDGERYSYRITPGRLLIPRSWAHIHGWFTVIFLGATFLPIFGVGAQSISLVAGFPITMAWILLWMILQTINLIGFYFTTIRPLLSSLPDYQEEDYEQETDNNVTLPHESNT